MAPPQLRVWPRILVWKITGWSVKRSKNAPKKGNGVTTRRPANVNKLNLFSKRIRYIKRYKTTDNLRVSIVSIDTVITCEEPEVPAGSYVVGYDLNVHSGIEYHCEAGYLLQGETRHTCGRDGEWSGEVPTCECKFHRC